MSFLYPQVAWLVIPLATFFWFRLRRKSGQTTVVSTLFLWQRVTVLDQESQRKRQRPPLIFWLEVAFAALLLVWLSRPQADVLDPQNQAPLIVVDRSGTMVCQSRKEQAATRAAKLKALHEAETVTSLANEQRIDRNWWPEVYALHTAQPQRSIIVLSDQLPQPLLDQGEVPDWLQFELIDAPIKNAGIQFAEWQVRESKVFFAVNLVRSERQAQPGATVKWLNRDNQDLFHFDFNWDAGERQKYLEFEAAATPKNLTNQSWLALGPADEFPSDNRFLLETSQLGRVLVETIAGKALDSVPANLREQSLRLDIWADALKAMGFSVERSMVPLVASATDLVVQLDPSEAGLNLADQGARKHRLIALGKAAKNNLGPGENPAQLARLSQALRLNAANLAAFQSIPLRDLPLGDFLSPLSADSVLERNSDFWSPLLWGSFDPQELRRLGLDQNKPLDGGVWALLSQTGQTIYCAAPLAQFWSDRAEFPLLVNAFCEILGLSSPLGLESEWPRRAQDIRGETQGKLLAKPAAKKSAAEIGRRVSRKQDLSTIVVLLVLGLALILGFLRFWPDIASKSVVRTRLGS